MEAGVNFRPAGGVRRQVAGSHPRRQPGAGPRQRYPIRVTWTRIGHQAIDGLDEGVWNHTVGDLGA